MVPVGRPRRRGPVACRRGPSARREGRRPGLLTPLSRPCGPGRGPRDAGALTALSRVGRPADIAAAVAFLASDDGRWVTGHVLDVSGGICLGPRPTG
ncbi:SDR family oxidoreductase [Streptosporangium sp. NPDC051022]|uniref:SDR family oxidoreductase n=1 Tax=Streptosporangium sp. NPDC051022 TaxID=3155752 RepID=UPI003429EF4A